MWWVGDLEDLVGEGEAEAHAFEGFLERTKGVLLVLVALLHVGVELSATLEADVAEVVRETGESSLDGALGGGLCEGIVGESRDAGVEEVEGGDGVGATGTELGQA